MRGVFLSAAVVVVIAHGANKSNYPNILYGKIVLSESLCTDVVWGMRQNGSVGDRSLTPFQASSDL